GRGRVRPTSRSPRVRSRRALRYGPSTRPTSATFQDSRWQVPDVRPGRRAQAEAMRRLALIILLVPFLGPRLSRPTEVVPLAPPPGFDVPLESRPNDRAIGVFLVPLDAGEQLDLTRFDPGMRFDLDRDVIVGQVSG